MAFRFHPEPIGEEAAIRKRTVDIVDKWVRPYVIEDDQINHFRREAFDAFAKAGLGSVFVPKAYGGLGLGYECYYAVIEEIARASVSMAVTVGVNHLPQGALLAKGSDAQKKEYLKSFTRGDWLGAFSLSEPNSGSDAAGLILSARKEDKHYVLNGTKAWCTSAGVADVYLVMARTGEDKFKGVSAFLVKKGTSGFKAGKTEKKMGLCASPTGELIFENCIIPESQLVGAEGEGMKVALGQLDGGRVVIGMIGTALAREALDCFWAQHQRRKKEGFSVSPGIEEACGRWYARIQSVRCLIFQAAALKNAGQSITTIAAQAKLLGSDLAMEVSSAAVESLGPAGVLRENHLERLFRDAKSLQIVEGTNQIQCLVLAKRMPDEWKETRV